MAGKKESTFINMVLVLFIVTLVASAALGGLYELTKEPIAAAKLAKKLKAIKEVVPAFDNNPSEEMYSVEMPSGDLLEFYPAKKGDELVGTAVKTYTANGFSGYIWIMVGFKPDGSINNYSVLEHKETPGLGTKMEPWFKTTDPTKASCSIIGKNPGSNNLTVSKDGGEVDAITAATISSRAFLEAVQTAYNEYNKQMEGGSK
ncbi:RnfABCDGE type electron transport complex subunit G [Marinifilum caeruleilacunae]|jgi:electron transport complex protein RnfG|uniref:Ion-translocating oxidoreductase complex subunit G n=1 Tax=Marinifilum caeruleilacunae TaxID=2499076 RepID=A0ABX1WTY2_9BACT|nr:RnfABCDGE type electron transport complex subunit G [Marinifilum caeruleilacunae]NOU59416.1 RnfABCDGE type electron transport complex subunit G [Marinifilum caeruleilacunae]